MSQKNFTDIQFNALILIVAFDEIQMSNVLKYFCNYPEQSVYDAIEFLCDKDYIYITSYEKGFLITSKVDKLSGFWE